MPIYKIVFSNDAIHTLGIAQDAAPSFFYHIDAPSADDAIGLAEIEFSRKHPQKLRAYYRPHVIADQADPASRVQHFDRTAPINPDD